MKIVISAGPTREYLDPIRYISNDSSGKMGYALAESAKKLGMDVVLISGPVSLSPPKDVELVKVTSALELEKKCNKYFKKADLFIMTSAVSDYRPMKKSVSKIKKSLKTKKIVLKANPDILMNLGKIKQKSQTLVGFCVETTGLIASAKKKLKKKNCDWIVANNASAIGADKSKVSLVSKSGEIVRFPEMNKNELALILLSYLLGDVISF